jgi:hypothetical protein
MADNDRIEHISEETIERFSMRDLPHNELADVPGHIEECQACESKFVTSLKHQRESSDLSFTLAPEFWLRHEHLDYEQLVTLVENRLDATDRELIEAHVQGCPTCNEDVRSFLAFHKQIAPEMSVSYAPSEARPTAKPSSALTWLPSFRWKPAYSAAAVAVVIVLLVGAVFLLTRRTNNQPAQSPTPGSTPTIASNVPSPTASPSESPIENPSSAEAIVLNDQGRTIAIDKSGRIEGLDDVAPATRNEIAQVVLSGKIDRPSILKDLNGEQTGLRGGNSNQPFKLISPTRTVIVSDRPLFKWNRMQEATGYTVYVTDAAGQIVSKSEPLSPDNRVWTATKPLKRGEIYAWTVTAVVDGKEITSPGPSAPEMKFQVLSARDLAQLNQLKRTRSHLALGLFYARTGLISEAAREFQVLLRKNPDSSFAKRVVAQIQSLQRPS